MVLDVAIDRLYEPPAIVSMHGEHDLFLQSLRPRERKMFYEALPAALLAMAWQAADAQPYYLRVVDPLDQTPDAKLVPRNEQGLPLERSARPIEVVTFTSYSAMEGLFLFLLRTKLSPVFAYPEDFTIVCHVTIPLDDPERAFAKLAQALQESRVPKHPIFFTMILGGSFVVAQVYPEFHYLEMDMAEAV